MAADSLGKVVVTGASGFVGTSLVRRLNAQGREVVAVTRRAMAPMPAGRVVTVGAYHDSAALAATFAGAQVVVHLAAHAHKPGAGSDFSGSVQAAECVAQAAARAGVDRLVLVSSIGVNGNVTHDQPFTEANAPRPVEPYAHSKLLAEQAMLRVLAGTGTAYVILRPPLVAGPGAPGNFGRLVRAVRLGTPLPFAAVRNARSFIALENLLDVIALCIHHSAAMNELFLVADAEALATPQIVREIAAGLGTRPRLFPVPPVLLRAGAAVVGRNRLAESLCESLVVDVSKARRTLGWHPRLGAAEGIRLAAHGGEAR